jgi:hypothetical protein
MEPAGMAGFLFVCFRLDAGGLERSDRNYSYASASMGSFCAALNAG